MSLLTITRRDAATGPVLENVGDLDYDGLPQAFVQTADVLEMVAADNKITMERRIEDRIRHDRRGTADRRGLYRATGAGTGLPRFCPVLIGSRQKPGGLRALLRVVAGRASTAVCQVGEARR
ncbi:hypothetical protein ACIP5U_33860 [Streptomyces sp. NPDC088788]|uniref:hypothetical protein n=1 Tax=Streptomyces sp. NPDC088788 TaxID=3365898 RepID=UPI00382947A1